MFTPPDTTDLFILVAMISISMYYFYFKDKGKVKKQPPLPISLKKDFDNDFLTIERLARISNSEKEKAEVTLLIGMFEKQYSHYSETRYNVQILNCINKMNTHKYLNNPFEFQN